MTKKQIIISLLLFSSLFAFSQQRQPTLMVLPSDNWMTQRFFMTEFNNQGTIVRVPDYQRAFQEDSELGQVISKIGALLMRQGYFLQDAEMQVRGLNQRQAEDNVTQSTESGAFLAESPLDILKRRARADVIIQVWWRVGNAPSGRTISFTLDAFDAYTNRRIASTTGTDIATNETVVPIMLEQAVRGRMREFTRQLNNFHRDINRNGREVVLNVRRWENADFHLETEINGEDIITHINNWMRRNTVNGRFNLTDATENFVQFQQVRIPAAENMDAREFGRQLQQYLRRTLNIEARLMTRGLGEAVLVLGER